MSLCFGFLFKKRVNNIVIVLKLVQLQLSFIVFLLYLNLLHLLLIFHPFDKSLKGSLFLPKRTVVRLTSALL